MPSCIPTAAICFIACHGGPADHFSTYAEALSKQGYNVQVHATGPALKKFQDRAVEVKFPFSLESLNPDEEDELATTIAKTCSKASVVLTDVGHAFDIKIHIALKTHAENTPRFAYYDNPEPFVPGGYSTTAADVIGLAQGVLFANATLAHSNNYSAPGKEIDFTHKKRFGIGYYPVAQAEKIAEKRRLEHDIFRAAFLTANGLHDTGQKILVYFGGNNEEYFSKAFPAFLDILEKTSAETDLGNYVVVLQQHPGAKVKNLDGSQVQNWLTANYKKTTMPKIIISDFSSDQAQILADAALYYQTSMGPQFALAGIPAIQTGHETYDDILVRNKLAPSAVTAEGFIQVLEYIEKPQEISKQDLLNSLGIKEDWQAALEQALSDHLS